MVDIINFNPIGFIKLIFVIHFHFEAHFLSQNFSNACSKMHNPESTCKKIQYPKLIHSNLHSIHLQNNTYQLRTTMNRIQNCLYYISVNRNYKLYRKMVVFVLLPMLLRGKPCKPLLYLLISPRTYLNTS